MRTLYAVVTFTATPETPATDRSRLVLSQAADAGKFSSSPTTPPASSPSVIRPTFEMRAGRAEADGQHLRGDADGRLRPKAPDAATELEHAGGRDGGKVTNVGRGRRRVPDCEIAAEGRECR